MRSALLAIFFTLLASTASAGCPSMCTCSDSLVSCRSEFLEGVPNFESLEVTSETIDLSDNSIFNILATDFSFDGVENVQYLFLNNNHIVDIHETAFSELKNVKEINLNTNSLDNVPPLFVADNKQLTSLDLSNNFFDMVTPEIYSESLEALDLSSTKIDSFTEANIKYLPSLKVINLSYNRLKSIEPSVFDNLPNLLAVDLTGNFWNCDQKTIDLFNFLTDKGYTDVIEPVKCITEEGFYQDIYTSRGPVDIFSISLESFQEEPKQELQEPEEEAGKNEVANDKQEETDENEDKPEEEASENVNEDSVGNVEENEENIGDNLEEVDVIDDEADKNNAEEDIQEDAYEDVAENNANVDDNFLGEEVEADNEDVDLGAAIKDAVEDNVETNDEAPEETADDAKSKLEDKTLEEIILEQSGKKDPDDITDSDIIDAINQLLKEEEAEDIDDYGEDYWENGDEFVEPEKPVEGQEEAVEQAKKIIEEEEKKEQEEEVSQSPEMGISVIREDQYIVLLERDSPDESQYGLYFRNNIVSLFGVMAFVLTFFTGIFFGFYAIREAYARRRRREVHGSTNVLIDKWSQDLA